MLPVGPGNPRDGGDSVASASNVFPPGSMFFVSMPRGYRNQTVTMAVNRFDRLRRRLVLKPEGVALAGRVTDSRGEAIPGARLTVLPDHDQPSAYRSTSTRPDGTFQVQGPGTWRAPLPVLVTAAGYEKKTVHIPPGATHTAVTLRQNGRVSGQIELARQGPAQVAFAFSRSQPTPMCEKGMLPVRTRSRRFSFTLAPGTWTLTVTAPGHLPEMRYVDILESGETNVAGIRLELQ